MMCQYCSEYGLVSPPATAKSVNVINEEGLDKTLRQTTTDSRANRHKR